MLTEELKKATDKLTCDEIRMYVVLNADEMMAKQTAFHNIVALHKIIGNLESHIAYKGDNLQKVIDELKARGLTDEEIQNHRGVKTRKEKIEGIYSLLKVYRQELEDFHQACAYA